MSQSVEEPSAAIEEKIASEKAKTEDAMPGTEYMMLIPIEVPTAVKPPKKPAPAMKLLDRHQAGSRELLDQVLTLLQEYKIPPADEFEPVDEDGDMKLGWEDKKAALYLAYDCSPLIAMDVGDNLQLEFEHPRQAIRTLAALLNIPE